MGAPVILLRTTRMNWNRALRSPAAQRPASAEPGELSPGRSKFAVHVVFTTWPGTLAALRTAAQQSRLLDPRIIVWFFQQVPRQFSTVSPPVSTDFIQRRLRAMARKCCPDIETEIRICLCTNQWECMKAAFTPDNVVVAGGKRRWWRSREQRMAAFLRSYGCRVLFVATTPAVSNMGRKSAQT
jgi:hypothetical protein